MNGTVGSGHHVMIPRPTQLTWQVLSLKPGGRFLLDLVVNRDGLVQRENLDHCLDGGSYCEYRHDIRCTEIVAGVTNQAGGRVPVLV